MDLDELVPQSGQLDNFISHFPVFATAPNGIEQLRMFILQLAVTGRLSTQNHKDSSSLTLLEKAKEIKESYIKELKLRKTKSNSSLTSEGYPFSIPKSWVWCQLDDVAKYIQRGKGPKYDELGSSLVVSQKCIQWGGFSLSKARNIEEDSLNKYGKERFILKGDLVWNSTGTGTVGRIAIADLSDDTTTKVVADSHVTVIRLSNVETRYIWCFIASPWVQLRINPEHESSLVSGSTKQVELNTSIVKELPIPLPPLEEQKRIVTKVDELMALCDKLEAQQQQKANTLLRANTSAIHALLNPKDPKASFDQNWQRIAKHFNTLYGCTLPMPVTTGRKKKYLVGLENLKNLRQLILKLGVRGKLTQTQSQDSSAKDLLELINADIDQKRLKKLIKLPSPECLFQLPNVKWVWSSFWKTADIQSNLVKTDSYGNMPHIAPNHIEKGNGKLLKYNTVSSDGVKSSKHYFYAGQILYSKIRPNLNKLTVVDFEGLCSADMYPIRSKIDLRYLCLYMLSSYFVEQTVADDNRVAMPKVNQERLNSISVPVPPLEEQKRIVAIVDQLISLCDKLEQQLTQSYSQAEKLMEATVKALVA